MREVDCDFFDMKGLIEVCYYPSVESSRYKFERLVDTKGELHPGKSASIIFQNKIIGKFGELHPNAIEKAT